MGDISTYRMPGVYYNESILRRTVDLDYYEVVIWQEPPLPTYPNTMYTTLAQSMGQIQASAPLSLSDISEAIANLQSKAYADAVYTSYVDQVYTAMSGSQWTGGIAASAKKK